VRVQVEQIKHKIGVDFPVPSQHLLDPDQVDLINQQFTTLADILYKAEYKAEYDPNKCTWTSSSSAGLQPNSLSLAYPPKPYALHPWFKAFHDHHTLMVVSGKLYEAVDTTKTGSGGLIVRKGGEQFSPCYCISVLAVVLITRHI